MINSSGYCIIVDGYSTGKAIAPILKKPPFELQNCIHIKSSPYLPRNFQHNPADYKYCLAYDGMHLENLLQNIQEKIESHPILCILAGSESGIELTDQLNATLNLAGNDSDKSQLRRNKYLMNQAAKTANISTVEQIKACSSQQVTEWAALLSEEAWPVVLKPLASQSGDHVFFCRNEAEIEHAFSSITETTNLFDQANNEVLAQSFNDGQEYIVNSVSCNSQHYITEIWMIEKRYQTTIYDYADLLSPSEDVYQVLAQATYQVLDVVGTRYGAGTTEFKYHPQKGPVLLETTSRPMAGSPLDFCEALLGYHQVLLMLEAYLAPDNLRARFENPQPSFSDERFGRAVVLISDTEGTLKEDISSYFTQLATYFGQKIAGTIGSEIAKTVNTLTAPGEVYLLGPKEEVLKDYAIIRKLETSGLYKSAVQGQRRQIHRPEPAAANQISGSLQMGVFQPITSSQPDYPTAEVTYRATPP